MADIEELLYQIPPVDTSGSRALNRLTYQMSWGILKLVELHKANIDYTVVFDYHEDIIIITRRDGIGSAGFYQVKSKKSNTKSNWTLGELLKVPKSKKDSENEKHSILGKMRLNELIFGSEANAIESINFVTNASINLKFKDGVSGELNYYSFNQLDSDQSRQIESALEKEFPNKPSIDSLGIYWFRFTDIPPESHETYIRGALVSYLDEILPNRGTSDKAFFNALCQTILKRSKAEGLKTSREQFLSKSYTRKQFEDDILEPLRHAASRKDLKSVEDKLYRDGVGYSKSRTIIVYAIKYYSERNQLENAQLADLRLSIIDSISDIKKLEHDRFVDYLNSVVDKVKSTKPILASNYSSEQLQAMVVIEDEQYEISSAYSEPKDEET